MVLFHRNSYHYSAVLCLEDGTIFFGTSIGADGITSGEIVFNTAITGYQEVLTDPSYAQQIVMLTYPHIGNVGSNAEDEESSKIFCAGLIIKNAPRSKYQGNWRATNNIKSYLKDHGLIAISGIDTRKLTRHIRIHGSLNGCLISGKKLNIDKALSNAKAFQGLSGIDLVKKVTTNQPYQWLEGIWSIDDGYSSRVLAPLFKVVVYDYGVKRSMLRLLSGRRCQVIVVPAKTTVEEVLKYQPDGVFLSNGPGDPKSCDYAITEVSKLLNKNIPIFGICLGHQFLAMASGAKIVKMKYGHHGTNHPVQDMQTKKVLITSQNHCFTVDENSVGDNLRITHRSLFDYTIQGIERIDKLAFSFQGHPESNPGPKDINYLFDRFVSMMRST